MYTNALNDTTRGIPVPKNPATAPLPERYHAPVLTALAADPSLSFEIHAEDWEGQSGWFSIDVAIAGFTPTISNQISVDYSEHEPDRWQVSMDLDSADSHNLALTETPAGFRAVMLALGAAADLCDDLNKVGA